MEEIGHPPPAPARERSANDQAHFDGSESPL